MDINHVQASLTSLLAVLTLPLVSHIQPLTECPCRFYSSSKTVDCSHLNLTSMPKCVPNDAKTLKLYFNDFTELYREQFANLTHLRTLDLAANKIVHFQSSSFQGLTRLHELSVAYNELQILNGSDFIGLSNLSTLFLQNNQLTKLSDYSFLGLSKLIFLNLMANKLSYLNELSFYGLTSLKILDLDSNLFYFRTSLPQNVFQPLSNIEELRLGGYCRGHQNCTYFDQQLSVIPSLKKLYMNGLPYQDLGPGFSYLVNLEELHLGGLPYGNCDLRAISNTTFEYLQHTILTTLSLRFCDILIFQPYTFANLKYLEILDMSGNIEFCTDWSQQLVLLGLNNTNIKYLDLSITCYENQMLTGMWSLVETDLETLDVSHSSIVAVDPKFWQMLPKSTKHLYFQNNHIKNIDFNDLTTLYNLITLDLSKQTAIGTKHPKKDSVYVPSSTGKLNTFAKKHYADSSMLRNIFIFSSPHPDANKSTKRIFDKQLVMTTEKCVSLPQRLHALNISDSSLLDQVLPSLCNSLNSLKIFNASKQKQYGHLTQLWKVMKNVPKLEEIDLSNNYIKTLPKQLFVHQRNLRCLWLRENSLASLELDLKRSVHLEILDLSENNIQHFSKEVTKDIDSIAKHSKLSIYLHNNSLQCDCNDIYFVAWLRHTSVIVEKENLNCLYTNGSQLNLASVSDIQNLLETECIAKEITIGCAVGFSSLILLLSLVAVAYYKRWQFKYLVQVGSRNINPYHPLERSNIEMEYDVYISYEGDSLVNDNETLQELVTQKIYPKLKNRGFRVLIRDELEIGMRLYEVISKAVRRCDKIIALLTKDYCLDYWNVFEFNIGVMEGIYTKRIVVVPIIIGTALPNNIDEEILTYLKSSPVPFFTGELPDNVLIDYLSNRLSLRLFPESI